MSYTSEILKTLNGEVEEIYRRLLAGDHGTNIRKEFEARNGFVRIRVFDSYIEIDGRVYENYTIYRIISGNASLYGLAEDLAVADVNKKNGEEI